MTITRQLAILSFALAVWFSSPQIAFADFKLCNTTSSRIGVAIGYRDDKTGWVSEGWWNVPSQKCEVLLAGELIARFYYVHAIDYDRGGEWGGKALMCSDDKEFTVQGVGDCVKRGYKRTGFFEVDTQEEKDWTVRLTDTIEGQASGAPQ
ncbi:MAG: DUF1036 domain-containing protein [Hyphomicrobiales bacterium]|nr:DUF1036 domain-containing protein [Hyphomicrobiales bacterium]